MSPEQIARHFIEIAGKVSPASYRTLKDFNSIPDPAAGDSLLWCGRIFVSAADPHNAANAVQHRLHLANVDPGPAYDLFRHEYFALGLELTVTEGVNFMLIAARAVNSRQALNLDAVAHALLNVPAASHLPQPNADNVLVSTNPYQDPFSALNWAARVDALLYGGAAYILCYKRRPELMGFKNDAQWFHDDFRRSQR